VRRRRRPAGPGHGQGGGDGVPWPGRERIRTTPPAISTRWRMLARPKWPSPGGSARWPGPNPAPLSPISSATWPLATCNDTQAWLAGRACHVHQGLLGDPVQHSLLGLGQAYRQADLDPAGDLGLLLEAGHVVA